jgi:hypothetical protein
VVPEGLVGDEALELCAASAAVCLLDPMVEQDVISAAQVVVRINVPWLPLELLAGGT